MTMAEQYANQIKSGSNMADKYKSSMVSQELPKEGSVPSYADVETYGMPYPQRDIMDVLTGRGSSPEEKQQMANQRYAEQLIQGGEPTGMESVTPMADFFNPLAVPAKIAGAGLAGYGAYKGGQALKNTIFKTTDEVETVAKKMNITPDELLKKVEGIPREDQAFMLAKEGGDVTGGMMGQAISQNKDEVTKQKYAEILTNKTKSVKESIDGGDFESIKNATNEEYQAMKDFVTSTNDTFEFKATDYLDELSSLKRIAQDDATATKLKGIIKDIEDRPIQNLSDMIELKQGLNEIYRTTKSSKRRDRIIKMKDRVDVYLQKNLDEPAYKLIKDSESSYGRMKTQEKALELLEKSTKYRGKGTEYERSATDWGKFKKLVKDEGLKSPEIDSAISIADKFNKKYGDMDVRLFGLTRERGLSPEAPTLASDPASSMQVRASRSVFDWIMSHIPFTNATATRKAQSAIENSIRKSDTQQEFMENLIKNQNTPESIRARMKANLDSQLLRPDVLDADKGKELIPTPDIIDTEAIDPLKKIGGESKPLLTFDPTKDRMIPRTFDLQSDIVMPDKNVARPSTREERLINLTETNRKKDLP